MSPAIHSVQSSAEEQALYDWWRYWVQHEAPQRVLQRFQLLFLAGQSGDAEIAHALDRLVLTPDAPKTFRYVLNRCCYILINTWQGQPQSRWAIGELVNLLGNAPPSTLPAASNRPVDRLRSLMDQFRRTEQYRQIQQATSLADTSEELGEEKPLAQLVRRYPYLYPTCLADGTGLPEQALQEQRQFLDQLQTEAQRQFELKLGHYIVDQIRRRQAPNRQTPPAPNPTLLTDGELEAALKHYAGRVDQGLTYQERAERFLQDNKYGQVFRTFKHNLAAYLISALPAGPGRNLFERRLRTFFDELFPKFDQHKLDDFLLNRTCTRLLNFMVVEGRQKPSHPVFVDLITSLGPVQVVSLVLKVVLVCKNLRGYVEKQFATLFNHYAAQTQSTVSWLVKTLENLKVALCLNFGGLDLRYVRQVV